MSELRTSNESQKEDVAYKGACDVVVLAVVACLQHQKPKTPRDGKATDGHGAEFHMLFCVKDQMEG